MGYNGIFLVQSIILFNEWCGEFDEKSDRMNIIIFRREYDDTLEFLDVIFHRRDAVKRSSCDV